jgi:hypothetical protein
MSAFAQTPDGDFDISSGNLVVRTDLAQVTAWKLTNLFSFFKGEWFVDARLGVPYLQFVFVKNPSLTLIGHIFEQVALAAPGVKGVLSTTLNFIGNLRHLDCQLKVQANNGAVLTGGPGVPFIVSTDAP